MTLPDRDYAIALANFTAFGPRTFERFRAAFSSYEAAWRATGDELLQLDLHGKTVQAFLQFRQNHNPESFAAACAEQGIITLVHQEDDDYPSLLSEIHDPPPVLFLRGSFPCDFSRTMAAFVGSRHCTSYGREACRQLAGGVARAGIPVVSGLAYGIDAAAHQAAIDACGMTIAVLPSGLLAMDNPRQISLAQAILASGGIVMSEFPLTAPPLTHHFPIRNRIISGLCKATVIVEAGEPSGTLITARCAIEQNRDVIAVPGPITSPVSQGTNRLIREGAHVATCAQDILDVLGLTAIDAPSRPRSLPTDPAAQMLLAILSLEPKLIDDIATELAQPITETAVLLTTLELDGYIRDVGGKRFILA